MAEFINRRAPKVAPLAPSQSPVSMGEALDFLGLPSQPSDPLVDSLLSVATDAVVSFLGRDFQHRQWRAVWWDWPVTGTVAARNVGLPTGREAREVALPYADEAEIVALLSYGDEPEDVIVRDRAIVLFGVGLRGSNEDPALDVTYYPVPEGYDAPEQVRQAVLMLAAWLYEHRGDCDAADGMRKSGAATILAPLRAAEMLW